MLRKISTFAMALACCVAIFAGQSAKGADAPAQVAGAWDMAVETDQGTMNITMTITQDGDKIKGTVKSQFGESPLEGSVTGNKVSFTVKFKNDDGEFNIDHSATVDGDSMTGTAHSDQFDLKWSAKRAKSDKPAAEPKG